LTESAELGAASAWDVEYVLLYGDKACGRDLGAHVNGWAVLGLQNACVSRDESLDDGDILVDDIVLL
jgi:hypothetical protein